MSRFRHVAIIIALHAGPAPAFERAAAGTVNLAATADTAVDARRRSHGDTEGENTSDRNAAFARALAYEVKRRTPAHEGPSGWIEVAFVVGASGRVASFEVLSTTDPLLEVEVRRILAAVRMPPPPGGSYSAKQMFHFQDISPRTRLQYRISAHMLQQVISQHMPKSFGLGSVTASFHLNASGLIDDVKIAQASSRAHGELVRDVLSRLKVQPPPGGASKLTQVFVFP